MVFNKCCCCLDLRVGSIVIAVLQILQGLGSFSEGTASIVSGIACIAAGALLLYGAIKYHQTAVLVYLIIGMIGIVLVVIKAIMSFIAIGTIPATCRSTACSNAQSTLTIYGIAFLVGAALDVYFWLCVYSFHKGLKSGDITSPA